MHLWINRHHRASLRCTWHTICGSSNTCPWAHSCHINESAEESSLLSPYRLSHKRIYPLPHGATCTGRHSQIFALWWLDPSGAAESSQLRLVEPVFQSRLWKSSIHTLCNGRSNHASWFSREEIEASKQLGTKTPNKAVLKETIYEIILELRFWQHYKYNV